MACVGFGRMIGRSHDPSRRTACPPRLLLYGNGRGADRDPERAAPRRRQRDIRVGRLVPGASARLKRPSGGDAGRGSRTTAEPRSESKARPLRRGGGPVPARPAKLGRPCSLPGRELVRPGSSDERDESAPRRDRDSLRPGGPHPVPQTAKPATASFMAPGCGCSGPSEQVFAIEAILSDRSGRPICEVSETYTGAILAIGDA